MKDKSRINRRILHTSYLHLASIDDKACHSLGDLINEALQSKVDLVIIAGDLFDHNGVDDELVDYVVKSLQRLPMDVVILPGNHDCIMPNSVYHRMNLWQDAANVHIFREPQGEILDLLEPGISLWGKPIDSYDYDVRPLAGIPTPQGNGNWHIAVAHGYYVAEWPPLFRSYQITYQEVINLSWDYLALGHVNAFRCVCDDPVKAYYSGSPSQNGTVAIVDLNDDMGVEVVACSLNDR